MYYLLVIIICLSFVYFKYNLVDDSKLTQGQVIEKVCEKYSLQPVIWDYNQSKQVQHNVSNQKIKDAGYQLIHPKIAF